MPPHEPYEHDEVEGFQDECAMLLAEFDAATAVFLESALAASKKLPANLLVQLFWQRVRECREVQR